MNIEELVERLEDANNLIFKAIDEIAEWEKFNIEYTIEDGYPQEWADVKDNVISKIDFAITALKIAKENAE